MAIKDDMEDVQEAVINALITDNGLNPLTVGDLQITPAKLSQAYLPLTGGSVTGNVDITGGNLFTDTTSGIFFSGGIGSFTNGVYGVGVNNVAFAANGTERMRLDASGNLSMSGTKIYNKTNNTTAVSFRTAGVQRGYIHVTDSATTYATSSDYRLKTDAQPMTGASARVQALNPVNFEWIADGTRVDGFLAHEAQEVVPESVTGTKDALDDEGNPEYQGIDQSKLVPLLTKALQEALTKIESLEARVASLENT